MHGEYDALVIPRTCTNLFYVKDAVSIDPDAFTVQFMSYSTIEVWGCGKNTSQTMCNAMTDYKVGDSIKADPKHIFIIGSSISASTDILMLSFFITEIALDSPFFFSGLQPK